jgi:hypothetical protein
VPLNIAPRREWPPSPAEIQEPCQAKVGTPAGGLNPSTWYPKAKVNCSLQGMLSRKRVARSRQGWLGATANAQHNNTIETQNQQGVAVYIEFQFVSPVFVVLFSQQILPPPKGRILEYLYF